MKKICLTHVQIQAKHKLQQFMCYFSIHINFVVISHETIQTTIKVAEYAANHFYNNMQCLIKTLPQGNKWLLKYRVDKTQDHNVNQ